MRNTLNLTLTPRVLCTGSPPMVATTTVVPSLYQLARAALDKAYEARGDYLLQELGIPLSKGLLPNTAYCASNE